MSVAGEAENPDRVITVVDHAVRFVGLAGGIVLLALMFLTVTDVGLRYFFNAPIFGGQDITVLFLLIVASLAIPYGGRAGSHVAVDLLGFVAGPKTLRWVDVAVRLAGASMLAVVAWRSYLDGLSASLYGQTSDLWTWIGGTVICTSGYFVILNEARTKAAHGAKARGAKARGAKDRRNGR